MIEVRPYGVKCNIRCKYCYQENERNYEGAIPKIDLDLLKNKLINLDQPFSLFGGEPLLMPINEIEKLFKWGYKRFGVNQVQSNGILISDEHVDLFKRYNVKVGISVDGPLELNHARWAGSLEKTDKASIKTHQAIEKLCDEGIFTSIILTLHKNNASPNLLNKLSDWILNLEEKGITMVRLHLLEVDSLIVREQLALTESESIEALLHFQKLEQNHLKTLTFDIFQEIEKLLLVDDDNTGCVWHACDPLTTNAVQGLEGNGYLSNCGRSNKDGVGFLKNKDIGYDRYISLYQTPQEENGCKDCRFFLICKGQCPGTSINGDWRNRSEHCEIWKEVFEVIEQKIQFSGQLPISQHLKRKELENLNLSHWMKQKNVLLKDLVKEWKEQENIVGNINLNEGFINPSKLRLSWASKAAQEKYEHALYSLVQRINNFKINAVYKKILDTVSIRIPLEKLNEYSSKIKDLGLNSNAIDLTKNLFSSKTSNETQLDINLQVSNSQSDKNSNIDDNFNKLLSPKQEKVFDYENQLFNILLAPIGLSVIPWDLTNYKDSDDTSTKLIEFFMINESEENIQFLKSILSWPIELSCLHGIAECKTPIFKFTFGTEYTSTLIKQKHYGKVWPDKGANGLRFPFRNTRFN
ncbi:hypothetical protein GCM10011344_11710 [Dokdonia pacifica]|uniref:Radical SAM additional 4Fe4S-binding SPASM domain-containing protein n=1 Tax=Dokdonia pacifica TaxID=1627892 RepID=A0A238YGN4_9FLAO|nr:radical SAM protein [Dokdonia pacifica]GGG12643.1 hypothetical protein GCM10011344_11710 [Dokdonia pacifica]SNR69773.1 radical SAM additional 4Fe4S-binding SPASM domain-containing protein [Dokdonia pacifica]